MNYAIILAAGSGKRMGTHIPKQFLDLAGRPVLAWTLTAFERADRIDRVVLVVGQEDIDTCREQFGNKKIFQSCRSDRWRCRTAGLCGMWTAGDTAKCRRSCRP